jgi:mono/diheme cytochrome c family protein
VHLRQPFPDEVNVFWCLDVRAASVAALFSLALPLAACSSNGADADQPEMSPSAVAEAEQIFAARCTPCHGASGAGDGPASSGLTPRPRNFHDEDWQTSVSDEHLERIIQYGGAAVGRSPAMPANPDLTSKPEVVAALRAHIRDLDD